MIEIAAEEGEKLSSILDRVAVGEQVSIPRNGRRVARLVVEPPAPDLATARAALDHISALAKEAKADLFDWEEWKAYSDEGLR